MVRAESLLPFFDLHKRRDTAQKCWPLERFPHFTLNINLAALKHLVQAFCSPVYNMCFVCALISDTHSVAGVWWWGGVFNDPLLYPTRQAFVLPPTTTNSGVANKENCCGILPAFFVVECPAYWTTIHLKSIVSAYKLSHQVVHHFTKNTIQ